MQACMVTERGCMKWTSGSANQATEMEVDWAYI